MTLLDVTHRAGAAEIGHVLDAIETVDSHLASVTPEQWAANPIALLEAVEASTAMAYELNQTAQAIATRLRRHN